MDPQPSDRHPRDRLLRALTLSDALFLVVASVIGSGIFLTPGRIAELLPHPLWFLAAWVVGGLLSLAGALANAELGAMFPHAGGDYVYLREAFHPVAGFLVGWLTFFVIFAGTIAALAAGFAAGVGSLWPVGPGGELAIAVGLVLATSALNVAGVRWGARANNLSTAVKVLALLLFAAVGLASGTGDVSHWVAPVSGAGVSGWSGFGLALSPVLFSYLGWNASIYVASEIRDPQRNVPRSLLLGLAVVTAVYLMVNLAYLYALPIERLAGTPNAGEASAAVFLGERGGVFVALLVLVSILGTLNATVLVGPRIAYAMALDGLFFRGIDQAHARFGTPVIAIWVQALVSVGLLLLLRTFPSALDYTTFAILLAASAGVGALYALRRRRPDAARPYRAWGYPVVPALYLVANLAIAAVMLVNRPLECGVGLAMLAMGLPFYALFTRTARGAGALP